MTTSPVSPISPSTVNFRRTSTLDQHTGTSTCSSCYWFCFDYGRRLSRGGWGKEMPGTKAAHERNGNLHSRLDARSLLQKLDPSRPFSKDYRTLGLIEKGAYGTVYRVEHRRTGEVRASKEVSLSSGEFVRNELQAMVLLDHPNVLKFYEYYEDRKAIYLICEVCTGGDFHTLCGDMQDIDEIRALYYDVFKALAYCHDQKFAHRDMKMENCLICEKSASRNIGKVIDFGLAAIKRTGNSDNWMNAVLGTKFYKAPEVVDETIPYGFQCDIWSVGVMLYITVTDDHPVVKDAWNLDCHKFYKKVKDYKNMRTHPLRQNRYIEPHLQSLLKGLLQKNARDRLTAQQAEEHEWFRKVDTSRSSISSWGASASFNWNSSLSDSSMENLGSPEAIVKRAMSFRQASTFERAILAITAYQEKTDELEFLRETFMRFDTVGNGTLSREELADGIEDLGLNMSDEEVSSLFEALDEDKTGKVQFCEFLAGTLPPWEISSQRAIDDAFDIFDLDRSGRIWREELCTVLGCNKTASSVLAAAQAEVNGYLSKDDFARVMREAAKAMEARYRSLPFRWSSSSSEAVKQGLETNP